MTREMRWLLAWLLTWNVFDVLSTWAILRLGGVELIPFSRYLMARYGVLGGLVVAHGGWALLALLVVWWAWRKPEEGRPVALTFLGLAALGGGFIVLNNGNALLTLLAHAWLAAR